MNVSRIEPRPTEDRLDECCCSTDTIGHVEDERMVDALKRVVSNRLSGDLPWVLSKAVSQGVLPR